MKFVFLACRHNMAVFHLFVGAISSVGELRLIRPRCEPGWQAALSLLLWIGVVTFWPLGRLHADADASSVICCGAAMRGEIARRCLTTSVAGLNYTMSYQD